MFRVGSAVDYLTPGARVTSVCHSMANLYRTGHTASHLFMKVTHLCLSARTRYWNLALSPCCGEMTKWTATECGKVATICPWETNGLWA